MNSKRETTDVFFNGVNYYLRLPNEKLVTRYMGIWSVTKTDPKTMTKSFIDTGELCNLWGVTIKEYDEMLERELLHEFRKHSSGVSRGKPSPIRPRGRVFPQDRAKINDQDPSVF